MSKFKSQGFKNTFKNARKGFNLVFKSEINIRIHLIVASLVLILAMILNFDTIRFCILLIAIALVIVSEMLNTAIEFALDAVFHNRYSTLVGMAKDISAGAVMFATFIAIFVGLFIFVPPIYNLISSKF